MFALPDALSRAFMGPDAHPTEVLAAIELAAFLTGVSDTWVNPSAQVQAVGTGDPGIPPRCSKRKESERKMLPPIIQARPDTGIPENRFGTRHPIRARYL